MMRMLKYPRLITLLNRQLNYERVQFQMPKRSRSPDPIAFLIQADDLTESSKGRSAHSIEEYQHLVNSQRSKFLENGYRLVQEVPLLISEERQARQETPE